MKKYIVFILMFFASCDDNVNLPNSIKGKVEGNIYQNDYLKLRIPEKWTVRKSSGNTILNLQRMIKKDKLLDFPNVFLDLERSNLADFENIIDYVEYRHNRFSKNEIYTTSDKIDSISVNGLTLYSFETKIIENSKIIPDILQTQYYFQIDTVFFHLSVSDYDRFEKLIEDYQYLIKSIEKVTE